MTKDVIRLLALVPYPENTTPSQRFRIEQWMPLLSKRGIEVTLAPFLGKDLMQVWVLSGHQASKLRRGALASLRRFGDVASARQYDAVFIHRGAAIAGPPVFERLLAAIRRPMIFDFDDSIFLKHTTDTNRGFGWLKFSGKTGTICKLSTHVVVGNSFLADYARQFNPNVSIVPTSIDLEHYEPSVRSNYNGKNRKIVVGWTGSSTSQTYLEQFVPVLKKVVDSCDIELRVISNRRPSMDGLEVNWRPWDPETEVEEIGQIDIGIMPMPDDDWSRGKCALKALQYMSMGIPTVVSAIGANCEVITQDENGMLASTPDDWVRSIAKLADDVSLRSRLGAAGRRTVVERYSKQRCAELFGDVVVATVRNNA